jgi:hypothetical protein
MAESAAAIGLGEVTCDDKDMDLRPIKNSAAFDRRIEGRVFA